MLYLFTLLSLPAYALFWSGKTLNNPIKQAEKSMSFPNFVATISLANVGDATKNDEQIELYNGAKLQEYVTKVKLHCDDGPINVISSYGIGLKYNVDNQLYYFADTYCTVPIPKINNDQFTELCYNN